MVVPPIPIRLLLPRRCSVPIDITAVLLLPIDAPGTIFVFIEIVIILVMTVIHMMAIIMAVVVMMIIMILRHQICTQQKGGAQRQC